MATDSYQIELSPQQFHVLGDLAARTHVSREQVLSSAIEQYRLSLEQSNAQEQLTLSFADRLRNEGLLGCLDGGPVDLSTNPDHMNQVAGVSECCISFGLMGS